MRQERTAILFLNVPAYLTGEPNTGQQWLPHVDLRECCFGEIADPNWRIGMR